MRRIFKPAWTAFACLAGVLGAGCADNADADRGSPANRHTIEAIQGSGTSSPLVDRSVEFAGVVTGDFQSGGMGTDGDLGGFFVQSASRGGKSVARIRSRFIRVM